MKLTKAARKSIPTKAPKPQMVAKGNLSAGTAAKIRSKANAILGGK